MTAFFLKALFDRPRRPSGAAAALKARCIKANGAGPPQFTGGKIGKF
jgi:hypothetical protein